MLHGILSLTYFHFHNAKRDKSLKPEVPSFILSALNFPFKTYAGTLITYNAINVL